MKKNIFPFSNGAVASSLMLALLSPLAGAAGLNEITVYSALGQPLRAEIQVNATPKEISGMVARLASPEVFANHGMNYAISLRQLRFSVEKRGKGGAVIKVTSDGPINDPIVSFMVDLSWPDGRLTKGYNFFLDPIDVGRGAQVSTIPDNAGRYGRTTDVQVSDQVQSGAQQEASIARRGGRSVSTPSAKPDAKAESKAEDGGVGHIVRRGETIHSIARKNLSSGVTLEQMAVALYRHNVVAFEGGEAGHLPVGAILRVPSAEEARAISPDEAREIYRSTFPAEQGKKPVAPKRAEAGTRQPRSTPAPGAGAQQRPAKTAEERKREREIQAREREIQRNEKRAEELERKKKQLEERDRKIAEEQERLTKRQEQELLKKQQEQERLTKQQEQEAATKARTAADTKAAEDAKAAEEARKLEEEEKRLAEERRILEEKVRLAEEEAQKAAAEAGKVEEGAGAGQAPGVPELPGGEGVSEESSSGSPPVPPPVGGTPQPQEVTPQAPSSPALDADAEEEESDMAIWLGGGALLLALLGGGWFLMRRRDSYEDSSMSSMPTQRPASDLSGFSDDG
ncbi:MAG: hypothetical protein LBQ75_02145, partial [Zoogloeaceae bacterium]|nr:hypothetical protein [Zoogloeaceae bacterium]